MASKRFSRLSIMLEARDRMSRPFIEAARAGERLRRSVNSLDSTISNSGRSTARMSQLNRNLAQGYRDLSNRLGSTNDRLKLSTRLFNLLPQPIKNAAYSIEYFAQKTREFIKQSLLMKGVVKTFNLTRTAVWNLSNSAGQLIKRFAEVTRLDKAFKLLFKPIQMAGQGVAFLNRKMTESIRSSFVYRALSTVLSDVGKRILYNTIATKNFIRETPQLIRNSQAWQGIQLKIESVRRRILEARVAFSIFAQSNPIIEKVTNGFKKMGETISNVFSKFRRNTQQADADLGRLAGRRATFNQLADANARLNRQLQQLQSQIGRTDTKLSSIKDKLSSINLLGKGMAAIYGAQFLAGKGQGVLKDTVGNAMQQNYDRESMKIVVGKKNGNKFYNSMQDYASTTIYSPEEWAASMRGAIKKAKNTKDLRTYMTAAEQLATIDPDQGLQGAAYAMRELMSGNTKSLVNRFELQKQPLEKLKKIKDPMKQAAMLSQILGEQTGFTAQRLGDMKKLPLMQFKKLGNKVKRGMGQMGMGALEQIAPELTNLNKMFDDGKFNNFIKKVSTSFGKFAKDVIGFITKIATGFDGNKMKSKLEPFAKVFNHIKDTIVNNWPAIKGTFSDIGSIAIKIANQINDNWPAINKTFNKFFNSVKKIADYFKKHWEGLSPIIYGVVAAVAAMSVIGPIIPMIVILIKSIKAWREATTLMAGAQAALDVAMDANPVGLVTLAIEALIAVGVILYLNWGKVRKMAVSLGNYIGGKFHAAWQGIKNIFGDIESAVGSMVNKVVDGVNTMIGALNKIPHVNIPTIGHVDWGPKRQVNTYTRPLGVPKVTGKNTRGRDPLAIALGHSHHGGLNRVPYDGYLATLHKDERVKTRSQANAEDKSVPQIAITGNTFHVRKQSDIDDIANQLFTKLYQAQVGMGG